MKDIWTRGEAASPPRPEETSAIAPDDPAVPKPISLSSTNLLEPLALSSPPLFETTSDIALEYTSAHQPTITPSSSSSPEESSFFAPDETIVYQPLTHSCKLCNLIALDTRYSTEPYRPGAFAFWQPFALGTVLRLARRADCPLFKTFFHPNTINSQRLRPEDKCNDSKFKFSFYGDLRRSHESDPTRAAPCVRPWTIAASGDITAAMKYVHQSTFASQYRLFHLQESKYSFRTEWTMQDSNIDF
jgi:hypothetical protein